MEQKSLSISDPAVMAALSDDNAMRVWHRLRLAPAPVAAAILAAEVKLELSVVHRALDLLEAAAVARKLPARGSRRVISYEVTVPTLLVLIPVNWREDEQSMRLAAVFMRRHQEMIDRARRFMRVGTNEWFYEQVTDLTLTKEEHEELHRRMDEVRRYVAELNARVRTPEEAARASPPHVVQVRLAPLDGDLSPIAEIRVTTKRGLELLEGDRTPSPDTLSARELEIARLLQAGRSRPEVAAQLGISVQTVGTYCKRLFEKLGIGRAIELGRFNFDACAAKPSRRTRRGATA
ncbi:MAG: hypothetical protein GC172_02050 [Phycisphaera sp.]|nr:hypothetical protein [Phycisphaera sp.]